MEIQMVGVKILFGENILTATWQYKTFKDMMTAVEWCRKNHSKIWSINDYRTQGHLVNHFNIMDAIEGKAW